MTSIDTKPWPLQVRLKTEEKTLEIDYDDGRSIHLPAELLRVESPSAEVRGHGEGKMIVGGKRDVAIARLDPVGNYALRIVFDDGHDTGIYSWSFLRELADQQSETWATYLAALEKHGLKREP